MQYIWRHITRIGAGWHPPNTNQSRRLLRSLPLRSRVALCLVRGLALPLRAAECAAVFGRVLVQVPRLRGRLQPDASCRAVPAREQLPPGPALVDVVDLTRAARDAGGHRARRCREQQRERAAAAVVASEVGWCQLTDRDSRLWYTHTREHAGGAVAVAVAGASSYCMVMYAASPPAAACTTCR